MKKKHRNLKCNEKFTRMRRWRSIFERFVCISTHFIRLLWLFWFDCFRISARGKHTTSQTLSLHNSTPLKSSPTRNGKISIVFVRESLRSLGYLVWFDVGFKTPSKVWSFVFLFDRRPSRSFQMHFNHFNDSFTNISAPFVRLLVSLNRPIPFFVRWSLTTTNRSIEIHVWIVVRCTCNATASMSACNSMLNETKGNTKSKLKLHTRMRTIIFCWFRFDSFSLVLLFVGSLLLHSAVAYFVSSLDFLRRS